ncbi:hypothetical protein [Kocuria sp. NPDC057446]|uniref:hypothetical protein n=1 Tax=Kocuria sp. NPDC057446 TaxID=3346137 RepID=UPI00367412E8
MPETKKQSYEFCTGAHWQAGVRHGLQVRGDRLVVPERLGVRPLPDTGSPDGRLLPAFDAHRRLLWLQPDTGTVMRWWPSESVAIRLGALHGVHTARRLVAGRSVLWTVAEEGLLRHDAATLQRLSPSRPLARWRLSDAAGDGRDGLWVAESDDDGNWRLRHVDCWGRTCREPVSLEAVTAERLVVDASDDGRQVLALDPEASGELMVVDVGTGTPLRRVVLDRVHQRGTTLLAIGPADRVHLVTVPEGFGRDATVIVLQEVDRLSGLVDNHQIIDVPERLGRPTALAGCPDGLVLSCAHGVAELTADTDADAAHWATFVTPALVSPRRPRSGWDRAEIEAELPPGTTMSVTWFAADMERPGEPIARILSLPGTLRSAEALDEALPWRSPATMFRGSDGSARRHAVLLNTVGDTTLWLRIDLRTAAGGAPPALTGLRIHYPNSSYLDHLPAIYQENPRGVEALRQVLAPYEVLLDGIDETLDALPDRISPDTASDEWTDYLLGWLGFPPLGELTPRVRRELLAQAPGILDARGTRAGLEKVLGIATEGEVTVTDSSDDPAGWFLGVGNPASTGAGPSRLGIDTVLLGRLPLPTRTGSMVLGESRLGPACPDYQVMLARRARTVTITFHNGVDDPVPQAALDRLLDTFVPAHCRLRIRWSGKRSKSGDRLDEDFRLGSDGTPKGAENVPAGSRLGRSARERLGTTTRLGRWPLPEENRLAVLDRGARPATGPRLL